MRATEAAGHGSCFMQTAEVLMLLAIGLILLIAWALGLFAFHVTGGLIHLLVVLAIVSFIVHLFTGTRRVV